MAIKRKFILPSGIGISANDLYIVGSTASTNTTSGALVVSGGVGISGRLSFNQASFGTTGIATNPTMAMIGTTGDPIYMSVLEDNSISFEGTQGQLFSVTPNLSTGYIYSVNDITGIPLLRANANANVTANEYAGNFGIGLTNPGYKLHVLGSVGFTSVTASTSTTTGTLVVSGGVGIGGSIFGGSTISAADNIEIKSGKELRLNNSGNTFYTGLKAGSNTSNTTYTFPTAFPGAGTSVLQSTSAGVMSWVPMTVSGGSAGGAGTVYDGSLNSIPYYPTAGTAITGSSNFTNTGTSINVGYTTAATNSSSGALTIVGGVGIGGSLYVAGDLTINGTTTTINSVTLTVDDKNIELGSVVTPSDVTAEGGGITLRGTTDKSINWYTGTGWSSSESWNLASGNTYKINNTAVLSNSSLGTGVTNSSLTALGTITTGVWAGTLITALYGGTGFDTYTKGDLLVGTGSTFIKLPVGSQGQLLQAFSTASSGIAWTSIVAPTYGAFYSTQTQTVAGVGVSTPITYNATYEAYNAQIYGGAGTSSRIQIQTAGTYNIQFSAQINLADGNQPQKGDFWFRINGSDVPQSNTTMSITGKDYETVLALNFISYFAVNDYLELIMSSSDSNFQIHAESALTSPPRPDVPSIILSVVPVTQIVGSSAGLGVSGIVSLNGLNNYIQYFAVGNSGSDFNISSSSQTHTINIPIAGIGATGLLTSQAQTIGGSKTFVSPIIGNLTGTATTATNVNVVLSSTSASHPLLFTPTSGSASGIAVSSNSTLVYNPSTDILSVSGMAITSGTASTNTTTGALVVRGGLGVTGQLSFATASFGFTGITTNPTMSFIGATSSSPITLTVLTDNSLNWEGSQGSVFSIDSNLSTGEIFSVSDISGLPIISASAGQTVNINEFGGFTQIGNGSINSSSTTTGSLVVSGGVGITGNANIGGTVRITNTTATTSSSSGALTVTGGAGIAQSLFVGGNIVLSNNIYSGGNTFTKAGQAAGDIIFDNGANDTAGLLYYYRNNTNFGLDVFATGIGVTRFRIVKDLNESGGSELWSIDRNGVVARSGWAVGETINTRMYNYSDLNMAATTTISATSYTTFATITYTPLSSSSYLWIEFSCTYNIAGAAADDFWSNIEVAGSEIVNAQQVWTNGAGGGTRSGVMFPLAARYTNSGTAGIAISVRSKRGTSDDNATIYGNTSSGFMRIQEIGR